MRKRTFLDIKSGKSPWYFGTICVSRFVVVQLSLQLSLCRPTPRQSIPCKIEANEKSQSEKSAVKNFRPFEKEKKWKKKQKSGEEKIYCVTRRKKLSWESSDRTERSDKAILLSRLHIALLPNEAFALNNSVLFFSVSEVSRRERHVPNAP